MELKLKFCHTLLTKCYECYNPCQTWLITYRGPLVFLSWLLPSALHGKVHETLEMYVFILQFITMSDAASRRVRGGNAS